MMSLTGYALQLSFNEQSCYLLGWSGPWSILYRSLLHVTPSDSLIYICYSCGWSGDASWEVKARSNRPGTWPENITNILLSIPFKVYLKMREIFLEELTKNMTMFEVLCGSCWIRASKQTLWFQEAFMALSVFHHLTSNFWVEQFPLCPLLGTYIPDKKESMWNIWLIYGWKVA